MKIASVRSEIPIHSRHRLSKLPTMKEKISREKEEKEEEFGYILVSAVSVVRKQSPSSR